MQTRSASNSPPSNNPSLPQVRKASEPKCEWTGVEEERLIAFLVTVVDSSADAGNFKTVTWNAAAAEMAKYPMKGAAKTAKVCSSKYSWVLYYPDPLINY